MGRTWARACRHGGDVWCGVHRTSIRLDAAQVAALDLRARREGTTRAHVIRALVDRGLAESDRAVEDDLVVIRASFGILADDDVTLDREPGRRPAGLPRPALAVVILLDADVLIAAPTRLSRCQGMAGEGSRVR